MSTMRKLVVFVVLVSVAIAAEKVWLNAIEPGIATRTAVEQLNGDDEAFRQLRLFDTIKGIADAVVVIVAVALAWRLALVRRTRSSSWPQLLLIAASLGTISGCVRPFDRPEYAEINTSET